MISEHKLLLKTKTKGSFIPKESLIQYKLSSLKIFPTCSKINFGFDFQVWMACMVGVTHISSWGEGTIRMVVWIAFHLRPREHRIV